MRRDRVGGTVGWGVGLQDSAGQGKREKGMRTQLEDSGKGRKTEQGS